MPVRLDRPSVAHYTGHMFAEGPEEELRRDLEEVLRSRRVVSTHGSLACGSDLLVVETALGSGIAVHAVLACPAEEFLARSVRPAGRSWVTRFEAACSAVTSLQVVPSAADSARSVFALADRLAMDAAVTRADQLAATVLQIALWDGVTNDKTAGTAAAVAEWRQRGHDTVVIDLQRSRLRSVS